MLLNILDKGDLCTLSATALILLWLGRIFADGNQQKIGVGIGGIVFLAYGTYAILSFVPRTAEELLWITVRSVIAFGASLGLAWVILPILAAFYGRAVQPIITAPGRWWAEFWCRLAERRRLKQERLDRQRAQKEFDSAAPEREQARQEAEKNAQTQADRQKRREDARTACEVLFLQYVHILKDRLPKEVVQEFMSKHMGDERTPEYVEERGKQLQELIVQHALEINPLEESSSIESLSSWYQETKLVIENLQIENRYKQAQLAHLNARYAELMQELVGGLRP